MKGSKKSLSLRQIRQDICYCSYYFFYVSSIAKPNSVTIHSPSLRPPLRVKIPLDCRFSISRIIVLVATPVFSDISGIVTKESSVIVSNITDCLSVSSLVTPLVTSLVTFGSFTPFLRHFRHVTIAQYHSLSLPNSRPCRLLCGE